jgi:hypothetical protein
VRRLGAIALLLLALVATGCGSTKSSSAGALNDALSYMPKDAPFVFAIDTNPDGGQWQQVNSLLAKFPFSGQVKQQLKSAFNGRSRIDYDNDIKPLLGNDLVLAATSVGGLSTPVIFAWKPKDEGAAKKLIQRTATKAPSIEGAEVYRTAGGQTLAFKNGTLVFGTTEVDLTAALKRAAGSDHLTEQDFNARLGNLGKDSLVRVIGDSQAVYRGPRGQVSRNLRFIRAQGPFAAVLRAEPDGIELAFVSRTNGAVGSQELPLAAGTQPVPVIRRAGEVGIGVRDPAHVITYYESVLKSATPAVYKAFLKKKAMAEKTLGVNIDRDLVGQLTGNSAISVSLSGDFAIRADLRDPAAAEATLKRAAPGLVKLAKGRATLIAPKNGKGFYALGRANGKKVVFGVVGKSFVAASDAARGAQFAGESPSIVSGTKGSLVIATDARALANAIAARRGQGTAAQLVTGALGDLVGWIDSESGGMTGSFKLFVK